MLQVTNGGACVLVSKFYETVEFVDPLVPTLCMPAAANQKLFGGVFIFFLASIIVAMLGMLYIIYREYKTHRSSLLAAFYWDGATYFACLSGKFEIFLFSAEPSYRFILSQPEANLHAVLATRMMLHLRSTAEREQCRGLASRNSHDETWGAGSTTMNASSISGPI
ncbi:hypothetical protein H1R20_g9596, partial [Candolleomyces eurysporus]